MGKGWLPLVSQPDPQKVEEMKVLNSSEKSYIYTDFIYPHIIEIWHMNYFCIFVYIYSIHIYKIFVCIHTHTHK